MLGLLFIILSVLTGAEVVHLMTDRTFAGTKTENYADKYKKWTDLPMAFAMGTLILSWGVYIIAFFLSTKANEDQPLSYANLFVMLSAAIFVTFSRRMRRLERRWQNGFWAGKTEKAEEPDKAKSPERAEPEGPSETPSPVPSSAGNDVHAREPLPFSGFPLEDVPADGEDEPGQDRANGPLSPQRDRSREDARRASYENARQKSARWENVLEILWFVFLAAFIAFTFFYVFVQKGNQLYSGFTVFGDYAPHTAMMRSFSMGNNFPTAYPHFGGEDIKYHFMFQFLVGNLEYLGLRLDIAYNLVSLLSLLGFLMILCQIARRVSHGRLLSGMIACVLFFFRSGLAFFRFAYEHIQAGDLIEVLRTNTEFIGYTEKENWGLWCYNVYLNQRHLAFGILAAAAAVWLFMDRLEEGAGRKEKGLAFVKASLFSGSAWKSRDVKMAVFVGLLLGMTAFFNGAAVIGALLILLGMAVFSDGKLDYALSAALAVGLTLLQTRTFISGSGITASFYWGFISPDKSLPGILWFIIETSFFSVLGLILYAAFMRRKERLLLLAFFFPFIFAFVGSLTPDITVNHKYIMIAMAFMTVFWGRLLSGLWQGQGRKGRWAKRVLALVMAVMLTATGVYDFVVILKDNDRRHRVTVRTDSPLTEWLAENLGRDDIILTPEYSIHEVTMSGVMMYLGWPYYAWSAGYDTYTRAARAVEIYTTTDEEALTALVRQEGITYILFEENMTFEGKAGQEETIKKAYPLAYQTEDGRIRIYDAR